MNIHPTAIVDSGARLAPDVEVGPYAIIGAEVELGAACRVGAHTIITGHTRLGAHNRIYPFVSLGEAPQDKKYNGEPTRLEIGDHNTIREFCTLNRGTAQDVGATRIGHHNWIMAYSHVAHDCQVGSHTVFANNAQLAGHVHVGDHAILGGFTSVHQFCSIGAHTITGLGTVVLQDIPPYVRAAGNPARPYGVNGEGLRRRGFASATIAGLKRAYRTVYRAGLTLDEAAQQLERECESCQEIRPFLEFITASTRGIIR